MVVVIMGVTGSGKTTVGRALATRRGWPFFDADDFHPTVNVEKMRGGAALTDEDREPWLEALRAHLRNLGHQDVVLACSSLRESFRHRLAEGLNVRFVFLRAHPELIALRLAARAGHFMNPSLAASQFEALEEPKDVLTLDASLPVNVLVEEISSIV